MDNAQREIRSEIEATRAGMVEKIARLEDRVDCTIQGVKRSFDPKYQTDKHPWLLVGLSVAAGYLFSGLILGRPAPRAEVVLRDERGGGTQASAGMLHSLTGMLSGVVTATAVALAREYASGLLKRQQNGGGYDGDSHEAAGQQNYRR